MPRHAINGIQHVLIDDAQRTQFVQHLPSQAFMAVFVFHHLPGQDSTRKGTFASNSNELLEHRL